jgi:hypothetical protein
MTGPRGGYGTGGLLKPCSRLRNSITAGFPKALPELGNLLPSKHRLRTDTGCARCLLGVPREQSEDRPFLLAPEFGAVAGLLTPVSAPQ